ncbi:MAG: 50S ribosomal protein L21 [Deltaproteobacteria bacterium]|jgi:large subunit ribosomal protein L21|nr:50S ribosomal protein L21 [Deltaproteobacteria bacterium]
MFAIIRTDGKQYRVAQGDTIRLARMSADPGDTFETDQVLAIGGEESELKFGTPVIAGAKVQGTVVQHGKDKKVIVFKRKRRKTYRRKYGHRQEHTMVKIEMISAKEVSAKKVETKKAEPAKAAPVKTAVKKAAAE